jgi:hypothetical protein
VTRLVALAALALLAAPVPPAPLPNLVELPPSSLEVVADGSRDLLRFTSVVENLGQGPLVVVSTRASPGAPFASVQVLGAERLPVQVAVRYRRSGGHDHFHLVGLQRYELRDGRGGLLARDHKAGYCLGDRVAVVRGVHARWIDSCGRDRPRALRVAQGLSPGFADPYAADLAGQSVDVSGLPPGEYELVNVVNPARVFRESDYGDDAASVRFVLARPPAPAGIAFVRVLAICRSARCPGA